MRPFSIFSLPLIGAIALLFTTSFSLSAEISFPTTHPSWAVSDTWYTAINEPFNIYVWRENGHVWMEIEPLSGRAFISGAFFDIVQNGVQLPELLFLEKTPDCIFHSGNLYIATVFRLIKGGFPTCLDYVDDPQAFILYFDAGLQTYSLNVPAEKVATIANFIANPISGFAPLTVNFTDQSIGQITSWSWDFGDGSSSTEQNPTHIYDNNGTYTVSLSVTSPVGSDTETKPDYIKVRYPSKTKPMPWIPLLLVD